MGGRERRRRRLKIILAAAVVVVFGTAAVSPTDSRAHVRERHEGKGRRTDADGERETESGITGNKWLLLLSAAPLSFPPLPLLSYSFLTSRRLSKESERGRRTNLTSAHLWHGIARHRRRIGCWDGRDGMAGWLRDLNLVWRRCGKFDNPSTKILGDCRFG